MPPEKAPLVLVAALFVASAGVYSSFSGTDVWDESRDARLYAGQAPVVAHPPCSRWCQLAYINQKRYGHRVGDDGGCFASALSSVVLWGGVLEHPARTYAWKAHDLPKPPRGGGWLKTDAGWVCEVSQRAYGHRARKLTWLFSVGPKPTELDWTVPEPEAQVSFCKNHGDSALPRLSKREASATPPAFAEALLRIARRA